MGTIRTHNLTKTFGRTAAISNIDLDIKPGSITGFLGPNGAGKSTTMNILLGFIKPTSGEAFIFGKQILPGSIHMRRHIGFLANRMGLDDNLTVRQELEYFWRLSTAQDATYAMELADRLDLDLTRKIKNLSTGNRQKVALIIALMHRPKLLILDEPTTGLDPLMQAEFHKIIRELRDAGTTIFISSHILSEVEDLCDEFIFIKDGRIIAKKSRDDLHSQPQKNIVIETKHLDKLTAELALTFEDNFQLKATYTGAIAFTLTGDIAPLFKILTKHRVTNITIAAASLEESFLQYYTPTPTSPEKPEKSKKSTKKKGKKPRHAA